MLLLLLLLLLAIPTPHGPTRPSSLQLIPLVIVDAMLCHEVLAPNEVNAAVLLVAHPLRKVVQFALLRRLVRHALAR